MDMVEGTLCLLQRAKLLAPNAFLGQVSPEQPATAEAIVIELDFLPPALDQAGAYIEDVGYNPARYLELYWSGRSELLRRRGRLSGEYRASMVTTWSLNFQHIEQVNPAAAERLRLRAFLEPDAIPEELLMEGRAFWPLQLQQAADPFLFDQMIGELLAFSLVKRVVSDHMLSIHRLVQAVLRDMLMWEEQQVWAKRVIQATSALFPEKAEFATWDRCRRYLPQAQDCASLIGDFEFAFEQTGSLLSRMATYLYHYALYEQAEALYLRTVSIYEQVSCLDHPEEVALSLLRSGTIHMHQGKHPQAEAYCLRAWQIWEQARGLNHPESASVLDQLGNAYVSHGEYEKAEQCYVQALHIREQALGADHFNMATLQNNLGNVYVAQQKYEQAEPLFHRARHIWEQALPPDHLYLAYSLAGLGDIYVRQEI